MQKRKPEGMPTRSKAIRLHCKECSGDSWAGARDCNLTECDLYPYRVGSIAMGKKYEKAESSLPHMGGGE